MRAALAGRLTELDLCGCAAAVSDDGVEALTLSCRRLCRLTLAHCTRLGDSACRRLADKPRTCAPWTHLSLAGCAAIGSNGAMALLTSEGARALVSLDLSGTSVGDAGFAACSLPALTALDVSYIGLQAAAAAKAAQAKGGVSAVAVAGQLSPLLTGVGVGWAAQGCPALQRLVARGNPCLDDAGLAAGPLAELAAAGGLAVLDVRGCTSLKGEWLAGWAAAREAAGRANADDEGRGGGDAIAVGRRHKARGPAGGNSNSNTNSNSNNSSVAGGAGDLPPRPLLGLLALYHDDCPGLTDEAMVHLPAAAPELRLLSIAGATRLGERGLLAVARGCPKLECLRLTPNTRLAQAPVAGGPRLTDAVCAALGAGCQRLHTIVAAGRAHLTDRGVAALLAVAGAAAVPAAPPSQPPPLSPLRALNLSNCAAVTDAALLALAAHCRGLVYLSVAGCPAISDIGVAALAAAHGATLRTLSLRRAGGAARDAARSCVSTSPDGRVTWLRLLAGPGAPADAMGAEVGHRSESGGVRLDIPGLALSGVGVTDASAVMLARYAHALSDVDLGGHPGGAAVSLGAAAAAAGGRGASAAAASASIAALLAAPPVPSPVISDAGVAALAAGCPLLRYLNLSHQSPAVGDASLAALRKHTPALHTLVLAGCERMVTPLALAALALVAPVAQVSGTYYGLQPREFTVGPRGPSPTGPGAQRATGGLAGYSAADAYLRFEDDVAGLPAVEEAAREAAASARTDADSAYAARLALDAQARHVRLRAVLGDELGAALEVPALPLAPAAGGAGVGQPAAALAFATSAGASAAAAAPAAAAPMRAMLSYGHAVRGTSTNLLPSRAAAVAASHSRVLAAVAIQTQWRGHVARALHRRLARERKQARALAAGMAKLRVRRALLALVLRRRFQRLRGQLTAMARRIQRGWRCACFRARFLAQLRHRSQQWNGAAVGLQRAFRSRKARRVARLALRAYRVAVLTVAVPRLRARQAGRLAIQRAWRAHAARALARRHVAAVTAAATYLQRAWRGSRGRHFAHVLRTEKTRLAVALQRRWRGHAGRRVAWALRRQWCAAEEAAAYIQRRYRGASAKAFVARMKAQLALAAQNEAAAAAAAVEAASDLRRAQEAAARFVQRVWLGHKARVGARLRRQGLAIVVAQHRSARLIGRAFRRHLLRQRIRSRKAMALRLLQGGGRLHDTLAFRRRLMALGAVDVIQRWWRHRVRRRVAATTLAAGYRGYRVRCWYRPWRGARVAAVTHIQRCYRRSVRLLYWRALAAAARAMEAARTAELQHIAASLVQAAWRGWHRRLHADALADADAGVMRRAAAVRTAAVRAATAAAELAADPAAQAAHAASLEAARKAETRALTRHGWLASLAFPLRRALASVGASAGWFNPPVDAERLRRERLPADAAASWLPADAPPEYRGMLFSVQAAQRRAVNAEGLIALHITVGDEEATSFAEAQAAAAAAGRLHYVRYPRDLSRPAGFDDATGLLVDGGEEAKASQEADRAEPDGGDGTGGDGETGLRADAVAAASAAAAPSPVGPPGPAIPAGATSAAVATLLLATRVPPGVKQSRAAAAAAAAREGALLQLAAARRVALASVAGTRTALAVELQAQEVTKGGVASRLRQWDSQLRRARSTRPAAVYLWLQQGPSDALLTDVALRVYTPEQTAAPGFRAWRHAEWAQAAAAGQVVVRHVGEAVPFELRARTDGGAPVTGLKVEPRVPGSAELAALEDAGYVCLGVDLGLCGLAEGLQVWVRRDGMAQDATLAALQADAEALPYYSLRLRGVMDLLQLGRDDVVAMHDAFGAVDVDGDGVVTLAEALAAWGCASTPFYAYLATFLALAPDAGEGEAQRAAVAAGAAGRAGAGGAAGSGTGRVSASANASASSGVGGSLALGAKLRARRGSAVEVAAATARPELAPSTGGGITHMVASAFGPALPPERIRLNFGEWAAMVATVCLFERAEMARYTFSYADRERRAEVSDTAVVLLAHDVFECVPGTGSSHTVRLNLASLPHTSAGLVTAETFDTLCRRTPALLFPMARLQEGMQAAVFGPRWWDRKKRMFGQARADTRRARDTAVAVRETARAKRVGAARAAEDAAEAAAERGEVLAVGAAAAAAGRARPTRGSVQAATDTGTVNSDDVFRDKASQEAATSPLLGLRRRRGPKISQRHAACSSRRPRRAVAGCCTPM
jgi:hypothetical protein